MPQLVRQDRSSTASDPHAAPQDTINPSRHQFAPADSARAMPAGPEAAADSGADTERARGGLAWLCEAAGACGCPARLVWLALRDSLRPRGLESQWGR